MATLEVRNEMRGIRDDLGQSHVERATQYGQINTSLSGVDGKLANVETRLVDRLAARDRQMLVLFVGVLLSPIVGPYLKTLGESALRSLGVSI